MEVSIVTLPCFFLAATGEVVQWEALRPGGTAASPERGSAEDPRHCAAGWRTSEVSVHQAHWAGGEEQCCQPQTEADGRFDVYFFLDAHLGMHVCVCVCVCVCVWCVCVCVCVHCMAFCVSSYSDKTECCRTSTYSTLYLKQVDKLIISMSDSLNRWTFRRQFTMYRSTHTHTASHTQTPTHIHTPSHRQMRAHTRTHTLCKHAHTASRKHIPHARAHTHTHKNAQSNSKF